MNFYIVDVFTEEKYSGNQLAVFTHTEAISDTQMQRIAREMNFSETTFITSPQLQNGGFDVRIFTPKSEIPFAGHPTLGTAYIIQSQIIQQTAEIINLNFKVGQIPVTLNYKDQSLDILWMRQNSPTFHRIFDANTIAAILNLEPDEIDYRFPIQEVSTGLPFFIVPVKSLNSLKRIKVNLDKYYQLISETEAKAILVFSPETYKPENNLCVRMFADYLGVPEDPATGSANGCLAGYLVQYSYFGKQEIDIRVEQGYEINRPSLLFLKAQKNQDKIQVNVGGKVILVAKGEFV